MKPQLAKDAPVNKDGSLKIKFPVVVQEKLDGIRCVIVDGRAVTRSLKEIPNREIFNALSRPEFEGLDGEIIVGAPTAEGCFGRTTSYVMTPTKKTGEDWTYHVFDLWNTDLTFSERFDLLKERCRHLDRVRVVPTIPCSDIDFLGWTEAKYVTEGHEGVIIRNPDSLYKFGRSGTTTGEALKIKRFKDGEAIVIDMYERLHNANEAKTDLLGRTERSSHKANKIGRGDLGGFVVEDIVTGQVFKVGTGFNDEDRTILWNEPRKDVIGTIIKYKHFVVGSKDLPRFPVFLGFRDERDMS